MKKMKYILSGALFFCWTLSQAQLVDSIGCITFNDIEENQNFVDINWQEFLQSEDISSEVNVIEWDWVELGPKETPGEGGHSKGLHQSYHGRGNGTGRINNIIINPQNENQVFACSPSGGLFYSENKGELWKNAGTDKLLISGVSSVSVNPENDSNWFITTGDGDDTFIFSDGVYRTFNKGLSWEKVNGNLNFKLPIQENSFYFYASEIVNHPCDFNKQFLATNKGLFKCGNALAEKKKIKWKRVSQEKYYDIEISPLDESLILAGGENLKLSRNCGKTWKRILRPKLPEEEKYGLVRMSIEFSREELDLAYVIITRQKGLGTGGVGEAYMFEYNLTTKEWKEINSLRKFGNVIPTRGRAFEIHPDHDQLILIGNIKPAYASKDRGRNFEKILKNQMHDDIHDFEFFSDGETLLAGHDGGVSISYDSGNSWEPFDRGIGVANVHGLSVAQSEEIFLTYGAYDCGSTMYKDSVWTHVLFGDGFETIIHQKDQHKVLATMQNGNIYASLNKGDEFDEKIRVSKMKSSWHTWLKANEADSDVLYMSGSKLVRSFDFGESWEDVFLPDIQSDNEGKVWRFYQSDGFQDQMYLVVLGKSRTDDLLYFSTNVNDTIPAITWKKMSQLPNQGWVSSVLSDDSCEECHYITYNTYSLKGKVFYYDGSSYSDLSENMGYVSVRSGIRDKTTGRIYLGTKSGVWTKLSEEKSWTLLKGTPSVNIRSMQINYVTGELFLGTFGRGIWKGPLLN